MHAESDEPRVAARSHARSHAKFACEVGEKPWLHHPPRVWGAAVAAHVLAQSARAAAPPARVQRWGSPRALLRWCVSLGLPQLAQAARLRQEPLLARDGLLQRIRYAQTKNAPLLLAQSYVTCLLGDLGLVLFITLLSVTTSWQRLLGAPARHHTTTWSRHDHPLWLAATRAGASRSPPHRSS